MKLEVCIDSLTSATNAVFNGADELEVCGALRMGGLTPPLDLVKQVIIMVDLYVKSYPKYLTVKKPKINVMIRNREGWDFCYNKHDISKMLEDIAIFKQLPVDRFVFGALTHSKEIDVETCKMIVAASAPKPVTFHRAFDKCKEPFEAMEKIIASGFDRVLTSGMQESAGSPKAVQLITSLMETFEDRIDIMPGAGINAENARIYLKIGCHYIHGSFSKEVKSSNGDSVYVTDGPTVKKVKELIADVDKTLNVTLAPV